MNNQFRRDAFLDFKVKRIVLCRKFPDDVAEFRGGLVHLRHATSSIFKSLNQMTDLEPPLKEGFFHSVSDHISKASTLIQKPGFSLERKLLEEREKRGFLKTFFCDVQAAKHSRIYTYGHLFCDKEPNICLKRIFQSLAISYSKLDNISLDFRLIKTLWLVNYPYLKEGACS